MIYIKKDKKVDVRHIFGCRLCSLLFVFVQLILIFSSCETEEKFSPTVGQFYILDNNQVPGSIYIFDSDSVYYYISELDVFGSVPYYVSDDSVNIFSDYYIVTENNDGFILNNKKNDYEYKEINVNAELNYNINSYQLSKSKFALVFDKIKVSLSEPIYNDLDFRLFEYFDDSLKSVIYRDIVDLNHLYLGRQSIIKIPALGVFVLSRNQRNEVIATGYSEAQNKIIEAKLIEQKSKLYHKVSLDGMNWLSNKFNLSNIIDNSIKGATIDSSIIDMFIGAPSDDMFLIDPDVQYVVKAIGMNDKVDIYMNSKKIESFTLLRTIQDDRLIISSEKSGDMKYIDLSADSIILNIPIEVTLSEGGDSYSTKTIKFSLQSPKK